MKLPCCIFFSFLLVCCKTDRDIDLEATRRATSAYEQMDKEALDAYPLFEDCDELEDNAACFYEQLQQLIAGRLSMCDLKLQLNERDSVIASITVDKKGQIIYNGFAAAQSSKMEYVRIDSLLQKRLAHLPVIAPALKRDVPVNSTYQLPIIFSPRPEAGDQ